MSPTRELRAQRRSQALFEVAAKLALTTCVTGTLDELAGRVAEATGAQACSVLVIDEEVGLRTVGKFGLPESYDVAIRQIMDLTDFTVTALEAFRTRQTQVMDYQRVKDFMASTKQEIPAEVADYLARSTWKKVFSVPLSFQERALGTVNCYFDHEDPEPEEEILPFLKAVADVVAVSVENSRLFDEFQGKAVLEERQRIARELHDSVSQALYGIALGAATARVHLDTRNCEAARESIAYVISLAEAGLCEMRSLIFELRPDSLENEGLTGALERQLKTLQSRYGLKVEASLCEPDIPLESKHSLYRVIQESLGNINKHAKARLVNLRMELTEKLLCVTISDDGVGFAVNGNHPGHYGLKTMRERVNQMRGRMTLESTPGQGTRVYFEVPITG